MPRGATLLACAAALLLCSSVFADEPDLDAAVHRSQFDAPEHDALLQTDPDSGNSPKNAIEAENVTITISSSDGISIWGPDTTPDIVAVDDPNAVELGVKFTADTGGFITAIRFFKSAANTGTHRVNLWTSGGTPLATGTFASESASGWQQYDFPSPIAISAGATYVASYFAPNGHYSADRDYFASSFDNPPLHAPATATGGNGVYAYSPVSTFPSSTYMASNYWVDVVFTTSGSIPKNAIEAENRLPGTPQSIWDVGSGDATIQGFTTDISYNRGETVSFKVKSSAAYILDIYRLGYYAGDGARFIETVYPSASQPQKQPSCITDSSTGLVDCGNWGVSATWEIPSAATSGVYFARAARTDTGGASHIMFVVRDDGSTSEILFKTSDTTWQAYNYYGGSNLYAGGPGPQGGAYKVSYNRPFQTRDFSLYSWVFNAEYPMIRFLEANGYDVSYFTSLDVGRSGSQILQHKVMLAVGHDEYWSGTERANVEAARAAGVHLGFFTGNGMFWKTRWEDSIDGSNTAYRTLVCYKETYAATQLGERWRKRNNSGFDPQDPPTWTGTWRDPRFSPPADGGRPENGLQATIFMVNGPNPQTMEVQIPQSDGQMRFWRNTSVATQAPGASYSTNAKLLGYKWDTDKDNGFRPAGTFHLSTATYTFGSGGPYLLDYGSTFGAGTATHHASMYRYVNGSTSSLVFGSGTSQWAWALDGTHDGGPTTPDVNLQQATVNLLADMGAQPATLQGGLTPATASIDRTPPTSTITSPAAGSTVQARTVVSVVGTAVDAGGGTVGGVEVSVDGGLTWHPANGRGSWTYAWSPPTIGTATIRSRAVDDSGNLETPSAGIAVAIKQTPTATQALTGTGTTGFFTTSSTSYSSAGTTNSIWGPGATPDTVTVDDPSAVELGVKFTADTGGFITAIRFFKSAANTGTHRANLWTSGGTPLATGTFASESASGWQQYDFPSPVAISAGATYVASYFAPNGHYSADRDYFASSFDNPPLHAPATATGGNGVYAYSPASTFPSSTYMASNYWVDVVFASGGGGTMSH